MMTRRSLLGAAATAALGACLPPVGRRARRLAICNETFVDLSLPETCREAKVAGFGGLEIAPFTLAATPSEISPVRRGEIRRTLSDEGMSFVGLHALLANAPGLHVTTPDPAVRRRSWYRIRELIDLSADLGSGSILVFGSGKQRSAVDGTTPQEAAARFTEGLASVADHALARGVCILVEPLKHPFSDVITTLQDAVSVVQQIGSDAVGAMVDCRHATGEREPIDTLVRRHSRHIRHVHLNEPDGRHPGTGSFDFPRLLRALDQVHYEAWLSVEVFDFTGGGPRIARESAAFLRGLEERL